ncbi:hypothetical protein VP01_3431g1, partial [Puccinia sorghi]
SLGHVSYHQIRKRLGIPLKNFDSCTACALTKIIQASFHTRHSQASKPFEEIHLDLVGPIHPLSCEGHKYFIKVVDSSTRVCSALPIKHKNEVPATLIQAISLEAKRIGYYPTFLHFSDPPLTDSDNLDLIISEDKEGSTFWTFKTKPATISLKERKKDCLFIQGFIQIPGQHFEDTFSPTGNAFLFAPLKEILFIKTPEGSKRTAPYLCLRKSLYGLKQAPANWYEALTQWFNDIGFVQSTEDHFDDLIVIGDVDNFQIKFLKIFPNSSAHDPDTLLGIDLTQDTDSIFISQQKLIVKGLEIAGIKECILAKTPLSVVIQLKDTTDQGKADFEKLEINYQSHTSIFNYLACRTCPDIAPALSILSSYNHSPGITDHWKQGIHCWRYLAGTIDLKLTLRPESTDSLDTLQRFTNAGESL